MKNVSPCNHQCLGAYLREVIDVFPALTKTFCWLFHRHSSSEVFQTLHYYNLAWVCQKHKLQIVFCEFLSTAFSSPPLPPASPAPLANTQNTRQQHMSNRIVTSTLCSHVVPVAMWSGIEHTEHNTCTCTCTSIDLQVLDITPSLTLAYTICCCYIQRLLLIIISEEVVKAVWISFACVNNPVHRMWFHHLRERRRA